MKYYFFLIITLSILFGCKQRQNSKTTDLEFTGSESCIKCHGRFYKLWSTSHHGKAMQPITAEMLKSENITSSEDFELEGKIYRVSVSDSSMMMIEKNKEQERNLEIVWALGGKNVYYFLTLLEKGKLQTIPLAYDINKKAWYNNPESAVRHFPGGMPDEALPWMDRMYTFNTSCYSCHVSQLNTNFDLANDSYQSTWKEPGINCETCHGPAGEHIRVCSEAGEGQVPEDLKLIITKTFTQEQHNSSCAPCHAKMRSITPSYTPGHRFFDNYDLITLENPDFYPDGRDLGENYTYTGWMMNECNQSGQLHCVVCHTSSGRDRFKDNPNDACIKCHPGNVENVVVHSGHPAGSKGTVCVNCHMPKTEFGRMVRSDHSFRPPMPEATIKFGSPNACNIYHTDKSAEWANNIVKKRKNNAYQQNTVYWAELIREARADNWKNLDKILTIIDEDKENEAIITSFVRLLVNCPDEKKWNTIFHALKSKSPLIRSAAAVSLTNNYSVDAKNALIMATRDSFRLVRVNAAAALAGFPKEQIAVSDTFSVSLAAKEYMNSIVTRPDDWSSHYNLGIYYQNQGKQTEALKSYETAAGLYPESLMPLINSSVLYSAAGNPSKAEENLKKALNFAPDNEAANLNLGLLLAEQNKMAEAEQALKRALKTNPKQAVAAYNLSVICSKRSLKEALEYAGIAAKSNPEEPKYAYTLAYFQAENKQNSVAMKTLKDLLKKHPEYLTGVSLLGELYMRDGNKQQAIKIYEQTLKNDRISAQDKEAIRQVIAGLKATR